MSRSNDPGHYFQSEAALATADRKAAKAQNNTAGNPTNLPSKILAILADPHDNEGRMVYVAESAGLVRRLRLPGIDEGIKGGDVDLKTTYRGPDTPLTCLALSPSGKTIYSGSWDKSIWSWDLSTRQQSRRYLGHSDFVKSVLSCKISNNGEAKEILISGSADSSIIIWDTTSGAKLCTIRDTGRILSVAVDPSSFTFPNPFTATPDGQGLRMNRKASRAPSGFTLYTASSDPIIRRWQFTTEPSISLEELDAPKTLEHHTSVNALFFTPHTPVFPATATETPESSDDDGSVLYTASSDKTARSFLTPEADRYPPHNEEGNRPATVWSEDLRLEHPDFVRAVVVDEEAGLIVTACRDEEVRVFDAGTGECVHVWRGHWEEVTGLALLGVGNRKEVVSVGIDGTVRCWSLDRGIMGEARRREEENGTVEREAVVGEEEKGPKLTEEEEAELRELMSDDDE